MRRTEVVGSISLYGTHRTGYGWLAVVGGDYSRMLGDGCPSSDRSATDAVFAAARAIVERRDWDCAGLVEIHLDTNSGPMVSTVPLGNIPTFGCLEWQPARVYTFSADALIAASESPA